MSGPRPRVTVVIPSWNGGKVLARHLPEIVRQAREIEGGAEVIVADDATELAGDTTAAAVEAAGEPARLLALDEHRGFAGTCNRGAEAARGEILLFLNSDMRLEEGALEVLATRVETDAECFAVTPVIVNQAGGFVESTTRLALRRGAFDVVFPGREEAGRTPGAPSEREVAYPCGGALACRRVAFLQLGGFWEALRPFYWEDAELGWRARRGGLRCLELGAARALHDHAQTIGSHFTPRQVRKTYERNRLLVTWLHLQGAPAWTAHLAWLPLRWLAALLRGRPAAPALIAALRALPAVRRRRRRLRDTRERARAMIVALRGAGPEGWPGN